MAINPWQILKSLVVQNDADRTKEVELVVTSGATASTKTTVQAAQTANRTISLPDASTTLVGTDTADSLTNKTNLQVDNINVNGNTVSSTTGALNLTSASGENVVITGTAAGVVQIESLSVDANTVTGGASALTIQSASNQNLSLQAQGSGVVQLESLSVDANTITGGAATLSIQSASNQNLSLQAQGTGVVQLESMSVDANTLTGGAAALTIQSASNQNLSLQAQGSGTVTVATASNQNVNLSPNGSGIVDVSGDLRVRETLRADLAVDSTTTGTATDLATPTTSYITLTNASLVSLRGIPAGQSGQQLVLKNATGANVGILNEDSGATAANRILTGTGGNIVISTNSAVRLDYDSNASRWQVVGSVGGGVVRNGTGTRGTPTDVSAGTTIAVAGLQRSMLYIQGNGGHVTMTANPVFTTAGINEFAELIVRGRSDTQTVTINNGNGVSLNGPITLGADDTLVLMFDGTNFVEIGRNN